MSKSKTNLFEQKLIDTALIFKALGHPARLEILNIISRSNSCITGDLSDQLPLGRTTVNQHLKELKNLGILDWHSEGAKTFYCLNPQKSLQFQNIIQEYFNQLNLENYECN
jgi:DNA-binding transcriptional ArsR family regulator